MWDRWSWNWRPACCSVIRQVRVRRRCRPEAVSRAQAKRVVEYVEANLSDELTLTDLASIASLSPYHFARMFKRTMGLAPHRYVLERRIERAKAMLRRTDATLVDISLSTGFWGQSHFTSTFRRVVGATPTEFQACSRHGRS
jgi:AraC family transcriptional regulator